MQKIFLTIALMLILFGILPSCSTFNVGNKIDEALEKTNKIIEEL